MSGPGGVFFCNDCGISFASAALLNNHKQRFCNSSRVDLAAKLMLESGEFMAPESGNPAAAPRSSHGPLARPAAFPQSSVPGGGAQQRPHALSAPSSKDQFNGSFPRNVYDRGNASTPNPGMLAGPGHVPLPPRSRSVEPGAAGPSSFGVGAPPSQPGRWQPSPGGAMAGASGALPPYIPPSYQPTAAPAQVSQPGARSDALLQMVQEQQRQISMMQHQLMAGGGGGGGGGRGLRGDASAFEEGGAYGPDGVASAPSHDGLRFGGNGIYNLGPVPLPRHGPQGEMTVVEGRYGVRVYAAEGLRAFYTLADRAPLELRLRQVYCRRRPGYYLPELEQRDEWGFLREREVNLKRRDGYVNFGRCEYVFNVVSANELVIVIELLCEKRLIAWTEVLVDSLGEKVRRLRHPPVDVPGAIRDFTLRSTTATVGIEVFRARWDNLGYDGEDTPPHTPTPPPVTPSERTPTPPPPPPPPKPDEPLTFVPSPCDFYVDEIEGMPLNVDISRVHVHVCDGESLGPIAITANQLDNSPCAQPVFKCKTEVDPGPETLVVVIVECVYNGQTKEILGHAIIPVPEGAPVGNYKSRLIRAEPNPEALLPEEDNPLDYPPCFFLKYRLHSTDTSRRYKTLEHETETEQILNADRAKHIGETPRKKRIRQDEMLGIFTRAFPPPADPDRPRVYPNVSFLTPYNSKRGFFVSISHVRGMPSSRAVHKVVVTYEGKSMFTKEHNYKTDIGAPYFRDAKFTFSKAQLDAHGFAVLSLYRLTVEKERAPPQVELVGHTYAPLFVNGFLRSGVWVLPWFAGPPLEEVKKKLRKSVAREVITSCFEPPKHVLRPLEPKATVVFSVGDPLRYDELTLQYPTAPKPVRILFPDLMRHEFPYEGGRDGCHGHNLSKVCGGENPVGFTERLNMAMAQLPEINT